MNDDAVTPPPPSHFASSPTDALGALDSASPDQRTWLGELFIDSYRKWLASELPVVIRLGVNVQAVFGLTDAELYAVYLWRTQQKLPTAKQMRKTELEGKQAAINAGYDPMREQGGHA